MLTAVTPYGPSVPSTRVRVREWVAFCGISARIIDYAGLTDHSAGTLVRNLGKVARGERAVRQLVAERPERLLVHKEVSPFSEGRLAEKLLGRAELGVYDFDDAVMLTHHVRSAGRWSPRSVALRMWSKAEACQRSVTAASRVIAGSQVLAEWASRFNGDVRIIPSCVDPDRYRPKTDYALHDRHPRLVWLGSPSNEVHLPMLTEPLLAVHRETGARLTVISSGEADLGPLEQIVDRQAWTPGVEASLGDFDLAVAPLIDTPYTRGKCAYKLVQYGAVGIPAVASPVGANTYTAAHLGQFTADGADQWRDTIMDLLTSEPRDRSARGATARAAVRAGYSFQAWQQAWLDAVGMSRSMRSGADDVRGSDQTLSGDWDRSRRGQQ